MANMTKKILKKTLKELILKKNLDDITVAVFAKEASIDRKTLYYHFHGILELLEQILYDDLSPLFEENLSPSTWEFGMRNCMQYIIDNKIFLCKIYSSKYKNEIRAYLMHEMDQAVSIWMFQALTVYNHNKKKSFQISPKISPYIIRYYSCTMFTLIEEWFLNGTKISIDDFIIIIKNLTNQSLYDVFEAFSNQGNNQ